MTMIIIIIICYPVQSDSQEIGTHSANQNLAAHLGEAVVDEQEVLLVLASQSSLVDLRIVVARAGMTVVHPHSSEGKCPSTKRIEETLSHRASLRRETRRSSVQCNWVAVLPAPQGIARVECHGNSTVSQRG